MSKESMLQFINGPGTKARQGFVEPNSSDMIQGPSRRCRGLEKKHYRKKKNTNRDGANENNKLIQDRHRH
ncbi:hypothetical protein RRG08_058428 [Elysia crispata]|uniref:Uncharacterized protein n=1 Tax=Elysia crispata TaxID=231223 RepID=A0AAE1ALA9_9GAST|nr:hypothetical protein RRG08_058428 [Elysia crispata]